MAGLLIDTCIIIEQLRAHQPAKQFLRELTRTPMISLLSVAELYAGVRSVRGREDAENVIAGMQIVGIDAEIARRGGEYSGRYGPSHGIDLIDAMLAATAELRSLQLVTRNRKHFPMLADVLVPY